MGKESDFLPPEQIRQNVRHFLLVLARLFFVLPIAAAVFNGALKPALFFAPWTLASFCFLLWLCFRTAHS